MLGVNSTISIKIVEIIIVGEISILIENNQGVKFQSIGNENTIHNFKRD